MYLSKYFPYFQLKTNNFVEICVIKTDSTNVKVGPR